jgi:hypothetical protein
MILSKVLSFIVACTILAGCFGNSKQAQPQAIYPSGAELRRLILSTRDSALSTYQQPGFIFKYGVDAQNVMNSFTGTYTLVADTGRTPSIHIALSADEIDSVLEMMHGIGFFGFPDTFAYTSAGSVSQIAGSGSAVYFGVRYFESGDLRQKELWWLDHAYTESNHIDQRVVSLRQLILKIRTLVEAKPAVRRMPRPFRFQRID